MQIGRIELTGLDQLLPVWNLERASLEDDEPLAPQFLEDPVDVNVREASRIGELDLGDGDLAGMVLRQPHGRQARHKLAQAVGYTAIGSAASDVDGPLPED